jgi:hypothetical protein
VVCFPANQKRSREEDVVDVDVVVGVVVGVATHLEEKWLI